MTMFQLTHTIMQFAPSVRTSPPHPGGGCNQAGVAKALQRPLEGDPLHIMGSWCELTFMRHPLWGGYVCEYTPCADAFLYLSSFAST